MLKEKNINLLTDVRVTRVEAGVEGDLIELMVETNKGIQLLTVAKVLVPGKRQANVQSLHLEKINLSLRNAFIPVDSNMMTPVHGVFAIGDVIGRKFAAHKAMTDGRRVVRHMTGETVRKNEDLIPNCLYTNPEMASIGLTQEEAEKSGVSIELGYFPFAAGARPVIFGQREGMIKVVTERKYGEILGVHIIGPQATELISLASMAMKNEITLNEIREVIYPHPSFTENFQEAINDALNTMGRH